jgi:hypothetical protein
MQSTQGMDKFLFTDGTVVKEAASRQELLSLAEELPDPKQAKIWVFNTNEWIPYSAFLKQNSEAPQKIIPAISKGSPVKWLKNFLFIIALAGGAFLIFNFTSVKWEKAGIYHSTASRPSNMPLIDIDSLFSLIEFQRGKLIDKSTKTNLRLRNTWPDWITLDLQAEKQSGSAGVRFRNISVKLDNSTGFNIDNAIVKLELWKSGKTFSEDTLQFNEIHYGQSPVRILREYIKADSLTLSFQYIRAKAFNFCYSENTENDPAKFYDRWFCRDINE